MTNLEKIKADIQGMTVEEIYKKYGCLGFHCGHCKYKDMGKCPVDVTCREEWFRWLESEAEE